jgi:hypothetical protein
LDPNTKTIKSVSYKNSSWDIQDSGKSNNMQIWKTNGRWFQMFKFVGDKFMNERGKQVGVQNKENIVVENRSNNWWARWNVRYVKDEQFYQTGEYHSKYGFYCGRKFYIVSKRDGRYLESVGSQVKTKLRNGHKEQQWEFNCKMEAIVTKSNQAFQMGSNGRSNSIITRG